MGWERSLLPQLWRAHLGLPIDPSMVFPERQPRMSRNHELMRIAIYYLYSESQNYSAGIRAAGEQLRLFLKEELDQGFMGPEVFSPVYANFYAQPLLAILGRGQYSHYYHDDMIVAWLARYRYLLELFDGPDSIVHGIGARFPRPTTPEQQEALRAFRGKLTEGDRRKFQQVGDRLREELLAGNPTPRGTGTTLWMLTETGGLSHIAPARPVTKWRMLVAKSEDRLLAFSPYVGMRDPMWAVDIDEDGETSSGDSKGGFANTVARLTRVKIFDLWGSNKPGWSFYMLGPEG